MVIRQLKQEEKFMAGRISGICFHERIDDLAKKRQEIQNGGIGAVSTLPEYRNTGSGM